MIEVSKKDKKVTVIGGGTGLSTLLRGLKRYTEDITAIVTVGDDGGGSGILRKDLGILPPGDIRNCILALADTEPLMEKLLQFRFNEGNLKGQNFGNLFLAAMTGISNNNFMEAIKRMSDVLAVKGMVLPVTLDNMTLSAELENGEIIKGESKIPKKVIEHKSRIKRMNIEPRGARAPIEAIEAIENSDIIVIGPGSLYTSIIPNLLVQDIKEALLRANGRKVYISNIMTQQGETDNYKVSDHVRAIIKHSSPKIIDEIIANIGEINNFYIEKYEMENSEKVELDIENLSGYNVIKENIVSFSKKYARHDSDKLAEIIFNAV
ncbi:gluconeogenesis factor YvcK family protein [Oceanirhabdus seepicola]|uniref:Putative gluconeogenesis factor n=1 Tax=Oceanirhabdus seepicola TaxID=2828781 RepID=A0A9J6NVC5_9CLOT|nr:gluconeogenesis factor YvcK family protein [Oceanirhabdus seepicola]MCM1988439.1 YvcK family protein [Oceanirhabdus seepicola]